MPHNRFPLNTKKLDTPKIRKKKFKVVAKHEKLNINKKLDGRT